MIKYPNTEILLASHIEGFHLPSDTRAGATQGSESQGARTENRGMEAAKR